MMFRTTRVVAATAVLFALAAGSGCSRSPADSMERGKKFLAAKQYSRALLEFRNAAKAKPNDAEPYYHMGLVSVASGDLTAAVRAFQKAGQIDPKHSGVRLKMAELMTATGDPGLLKHAENSLHELLDESPKNADALSALAVTELRLGRTEEAVDALQQTLAIAPQELRSSLMLAAAKLSQKDMKGAEEVLKKACDSAPKAVEPRIVLGIFYLRQTRLPEAEAEFRRALQIDSGSGQALLRLARIEHMTGRKAEAEQHVKQLSSMGDTNFAHMHALFLFEEGRRDEAIREFERLSRSNPKDRAARTRLVTAYRATSRVADAEKVLDAALEKNAKDTEALMQRADLSLAAGDYAAVEVYLNRVVRLHPDSADVRYSLASLYRARGSILLYRQQLTEALSKNPFFLPARIELAQALIAAKNGRAALDVLNEAPASQKELTSLLVQRNWALWEVGDLAALRKGIDQGLARERSPDLLIQDGLWKVRTGNSAGAQTVLDEALRGSNGDVRALAIMNSLLRAEKKSGLALQKVKEYAAEQPKSAAVQHFYGTVLMANGDREEAKAAFTAAKSADPQHAMTDYSLVQLAVLERRWDDARKTLRTMVTQNGGNAVARMWLGNVEHLTGNGTAAIEHFRKVVEVQPDDPQALNNLAYLVSERENRLDEALKYAEKARERAPDNPEIADTLGWIFYRKGLYGAAIPHLEIAAARSRNPACKYHLAMAYAKAGDPVKGRAALVAARKANPKLAEADEAARLLGSVP